MATHILCLTSGTKGCRHQLFSRPELLGRSGYPTILGSWSFWKWKSQALWCDVIWFIRIICNAMFLLCLISIRIFSLLLLIWTLTTCQVCQALNLQNSSNRGKRDNLNDSDGPVLYVPQTAAPPCRHIGAVRSPSIPQSLWCFFLMVRMLGISYDGFQWSKS